MTAEASAEDEEYTNASKGLETTTEAAGGRRQARGMYDGNGGVSGGR